MADLPKEHIIFGKDPNLNTSSQIQPVRKNKTKISIDTQHLDHNPTNSNILYSPGDKVIHKTFGEGIITSSKQVSNDYEITVAFKNSGGIKKLLASLANLSKV